MATQKKSSAKKSSGGFSAAEKAAMKERAAEMRAEKAAGKAKDKAAADAKAQKEKIASFTPKDRALAKKVAAIVSTNAPDLAPKLWYGMPAWADADGKVVCFFKDAAKFGSRYATFGFEEAAKVDAGGMWVTSFAITELTAADEKKLATLVKKAVK